MCILRQYVEAYRAIQNYFGFAADHLPIEDRTDVYWRLDVQRITSCEDEDLDSDDVYETRVWTTRELYKWVFRKKDYTMIVEDHMCDGRKTFSIFDNAKERPNAR